MTTFITNLLANGEECAVQVKGDVISFLYPAGAKEDVHIGARNVRQLLRSRKDDTTAKMIAAESSYVLKFETLQKREQFIESVIRVQEREQPLSHDDWIRSTICHTAVDVGMLDEGELEKIMKAEGQRGVEQAFDALETLVDHDTFELLPITEQRENDVLRQIPVLAAIFQERVVDTESKKSFWEAVVRKYFCFSRTFLEDDIQRLDAPKSSVTAMSPSSSGGSVSSPLSAINASSTKALPKGAVAATVDTDVNEEDLLRWNELASSTPSPFEFYFAASRHVCEDLSSAIPVTGELLPVPSVMIAPPTAPALRYLGHEVLREFPAEPIERTTLETLRVFWRSGAKQHKRLLDLQVKGKKAPSSFIQRVCLEQALRTLQHS